MWFGGLSALLIDVGIAAALTNPVYFYDFYLIAGVLKALDFVIDGFISKLCIWFRLMVGAGFHDGGCYRLHTLTG